MKTGSMKTGVAPAEGFLSALSRRAILWAARAPAPSAALVRRRLYDFNRLPITPSWASRLPDRHSVERFLGADREPPAGWRRRPRTPGESWIGFERLEPACAEPVQAPAGPFKLYISPRPGHLPAALEGLWPLLARWPATAFKVADSVSGLMRPDKLIVYSPRLEWIEALARRFLAGWPGGGVHGVPFTAEIGGRGLLSWGVDRHRGGLVRSWRSWLVERLGGVLVRPRACGPKRRHSRRDGSRQDGSRQDGPVRHRFRRRGPPAALDNGAVARSFLSALRLDPRLGDVDLDRWQPRSRLWLPAP